METDSRALGTHADEVVALARGRTLLLYPSRDAWGPLPPAVTDVVLFVPGGRLVGTFDSIVSIGQLGAAPGLAGLLTDLAQHADQGTRLLFCEPTITADEPSSAPPHDVTATLWDSGWSVIDCRRFRVGRGRRAQDHVWGRARLALG